MFIELLLVFQTYEGLKCSMKLLQLHHEIQKYLKELRKLQDLMTRPKFKRRFNFSSTKQSNMKNVQQISEYNKYGTEIAQGEKIQPH